MFLTSYFLKCLMTVFKPRRNKTDIGIEVRREMDLREARSSASTYTLIFFFRFPAILLQMYHRSLTSA